MLEGLEISEVKLSEIFNNLISNRIDSEHFLKKYTTNIETIKSYKNGFFTLKDLLKRISGGATPLGAEYSEKGIAFLRVQNIMQNYFDLNDVVYITKQQDEEIKRSRLKENDVLLTITGSYGKSAVVSDNLINANINQHSVKMELKKELNPFFLSTFFNSKFGKLQSDVNVVGVTRPALDYESIRNFIIPNVPVDFQGEIEKIIIQSKNKEKQSKTLYSEAENLLLEELGLKDWQPKNENISIKHFSDFAQTGRLDAEYYQPKYDEAEEKIKLFKQFAITDIFDLLSNPSPSNYTSIGTKVIKTKNVRIPSVNFDSITDCTDADSLIVEKNDLLFASMGVGSLGRISYIKEVNQCCTIDGTIRLMRTKQEYKQQNYEIPTMLFLTSKIGQEVIYKHVIGSTGIISISKDKIANLKIPILSTNIRQKLSKLVNQSQELKAESKRLLEVAKTAVEVAIEQSEDKGLQLLKNI